jgi:hypothetical protein
MKDSTTNLDLEFVEFFAGILIGAGIVLPLQLLFGKRKI